MLKKLSALILVALLLLMPLSVLSVSAASTTTVSFAPYAYSETNKRMEAQTRFNSGSCVYVAMVFARTEELGGYTLKMTYDPSAFTFEKGKMLDVTGVEGSEFFANAVSGTVHITWETTKNYTAEGVVLYIPFTVNRGVSEEKDYTFTAQISEVFKNNATQSLISTTIGSQATVTLAFETVPQAFLDLVSGLTEVHYNPTNIATLPADSLTDINTAEKFFLESMSPVQQQTFFTRYPALYEALSSARNRYYTLASTQANALAQAELQAFLDGHATILSKEANKLALTDATAVNAMGAAFDLLSTKALSKMAEATKTKVSALRAKLKSMIAEDTAYQAALQEVADFRRDYANYVEEASYNEVVKGFKDAYETYYPYVSEAKIVFDSLLSEKAKEMLSAESERLNNLVALAEKYTAEDKEAAALLAKVDDFIQRYVYVFTLNKLSVSIGDESAVQMVIDAYNQLKDEGMKTMLKSKISTLEDCKTAIAALKVVQDDVDDDDDVVVIPPEDTNGETPKTETIVQTNVVEKLINRIYRSNNAFRVAFFPLLILLFLSIFCLVATMFVMQNTKKNYAERSVQNEAVEE